VVATLVTRRAPWLAPVGVAGLALGGCVAVAVLDPAARSELSPGCPFRALTGLDCPGCGGTRALYALTQGQIATSLSHNLLVWVVAPLLVVAWGSWLLTTLGRREGVWQPRPRLAWALAWATIGFWVLRNVPVAPLTWLGSAPT
jgi:hypothetical protein